MGGCFTPLPGEAGHIPELFSPTISLIHWLARGRKDKSTAFDGSPFNGGGGGGDRKETCEVHFRNPTLLLLTK